MKKALYYAIRNNLYSTVVAVTSEKRNGTRWAGRDTRYNEVTHGTSDQLRGRFETQEAAEGKREQILVIAAQFEQKRKIYLNAITELHRQERTFIDALIKGEGI